MPVCSACLRCITQTSVLDSNAYPGIFGNTVVTLIPYPLLPQGEGEDSVPRPEGEG